jgi:hypothetical protein
MGRTDMPTPQAKYAVGQRVSYVTYGCAGQQSAGVGTVTRLPIPEAFADPWNIAGRYYRVRHDGGTATRYIEIGVLEDEITGAADAAK